MKVDDPWAGFTGESSEEHVYAEGWRDGRDDALIALQWLVKRGLAATEAEIREKQAEAWDEGHSHCFHVKAPNELGNPYRDGGFTDG